MVPRTPWMECRRTIYPLPHKTPRTQHGFAQTTFHTQDISLRQSPRSDSFPLRQVADFVHSLGLKFGLCGASPYPSQSG
eukprot:COSAG02_NODE_43437_length_375_cov_0.402174_1_plen_78_part_10